MGRPARSLHDAGNHRAVERRSPRQAARPGGGLTIPASPAGERETTAALTPLLGARSLRPEPGGEPRAVAPDPYAGRLRTAVPPGPAVPAACSVVRSVPRRR